MARTLILTSRSNPLIKETLRLKQRPPGPEGGPILIEGPHLIREALACGCVVERLFASRSFLASREGKSFAGGVPGGPATITETTDQILSLLSDTENPSGIAAVVAYSPTPLNELSLGRTPLLVIADGVQDPGNLGAIIRVADAAAADAVLMMPGTCNPLIPKVVRATAGSIFHIPMVFTDHGMLLQFLDNASIPLYATDARSPVSLFECGLTKGFALALGNEARGVSAGLRGGADKILAIPIPGRAESINVAMAASVCLYETVRQRGVHPQGMPRAASGS